MATQKTTYLICDGCHKDELHHGIMIIHSQKIPHIDKTFDLCSRCIDHCYLCTQCHSTHSDYDFSDWLKSKGVQSMSDPKYNELMVQFPYAFKGDFCPEFAELPY